MKRLRMIAGLFALVILVSGCNIMDILTSVNVNIRVLKLERPGVPPGSPYPNVTVKLCDNNGNPLEASVTDKNGIATFGVDGGTKRIVVRFEFYTASPIKTIKTGPIELWLPDVAPGTHVVSTQDIVFSDDPYVYPVQAMQQDSTFTVESITAVESNL